MEAKFSNRVKEVISLSREEALRLGHDYIGTEHLLLGLIREGEGVAVGVLKKLGVPLDELRGEVEKVSKGTATHEVKNLAKCKRFIIDPFSFFIFYVPLNFSVLFFEVDLYNVLSLIIVF